MLRISVNLYRQQLTSHCSINSKMPRRESLKMVQEMTKVSSAVHKLNGFFCKSLLEVTQSPFLICSWWDQGVYNAWWNDEKQWQVGGPDREG